MQQIGGLMIYLSNCHPRFVTVLPTAINRLGSQLSVDTNSAIRVNDPCCIGKIKLAHSTHLSMGPLMTICKSSAKSWAVSTT